MSSELSDKEEVFIGPELTNGQHESDDDDESQNKDSDSDNYVSQVSTLLQ